MTLVAGVIIPLMAVKAYNFRYLDPYIKWSMYWGYNEYIIGYMMGIDKQEVGFPFSNQTMLEQLGYVNHGL